MKFTPEQLDHIRRTCGEFRVITPRDISKGLSGTRPTSVLFDELHKDGDMATKQKKKQLARRVATQSDRSMPSKKMPVTVRDPLSRRIVKRS